MSEASCPPRVRGGLGWIAVLAVTALVGCAKPAGAPAVDSTGPCISLGTRLGTIRMGLDPAAGPHAFVSLLESAGAAGNGWVGQSIDFARPRLELRIPPPLGSESRTIPTEIDAVELGLDRDTLADAGAAMNWIQAELYPALRRPTDQRRPTPIAEGWAKQFDATHDPSFLLGTSRRELLEAIGFRFRPGLASKPPVAGAVLLVPAAPDLATLGLCVLLADHPIRRGKWVVVGHMIEGEPVAKEISLMPLSSPAARDFRPAEPIRILTASIDAKCPL